MKMNDRKCFFCMKPMGNSSHTIMIVSLDKEKPQHQLRHAHKKCEREFDEE